ncbi:hypothetical protein Tco_1046088 [Tanacetum coccineum]
METQKPLLKDEDGEEVDVHLYRSMIGSLMYLTSSRIDIMFAVCACAKYQVNPKVSHLHSMKRIFRYLKGQPKLGLWYPKDSHFDLVAYTDNDYARASLDRKSTTGGCQFLRCRLISWQCKKQTVVANSITEAEYVVALSCCGQVLWIQNQLHDYGDSNEKKLIQMIKIHIDKNVADLLTKAFDSSVPVENVADEAIYEERDGSLERATTTATSLDAKKDRGNISKTQSKATPNELSFIRTSSGGGPRRQDTMGDTIAQTMSKNVSKFSDDPLLTGVGLSTRIDSSDDEASLGDQEDASKQGRKIHDIDADEDITLENVHDAEMFDVNDVDGDKIVVESEVADKDVNLCVDEVTLAQALAI